MGKIIYDLALTLDYNNFKEVGKKTHTQKPKTGLDTRNHTHAWDYTNIFWCSILDRCYHMDASKESMNSTLTDVLDKILTGREKSIFSGVFLSYTVDSPLSNKPANTPLTST